jgi:hypothetical protein
VFMHFTRNIARSDERPIIIKGQEVLPTARAKILGVVMDSELRFKELLAKAATRGLEAAIALKRVSGLLPPTARRLFEATVALVVDYASSVWMLCGHSDVEPNPEDRRTSDHRLLSHRGRLCCGG